MGKIPDSIVTKGGLNTESFYDFIISRYIAPYFTIILNKIKKLTPNQVTLISFLTLITAGVLTLNVKYLGNIVYRTTIALLIQLAFILDCCDGQLARLSRRTSKVGGWLDKLLDRVGEFYIFTVVGIVAWIRTGNVLFFIFGVITGYSLVAFTLAMSLSDSAKLENVKHIKELRKLNSKEKIKKQVKKKSFKESRFSLVIQKVFFFLNFGIGERYLYLSFFILIYRLDVMLYFTTLLSVMRFISISYYVGNKLRNLDKKIKQMII